MHACGHDCHAAVLLGAAQLLKAHEDEIEGTVKLMFQPAEETMEGGLEMVEGGVLENPHVDAAMAGHVLTATPMPVGSLILMGSKTKMAAVDWFTVHIVGKGCHGAMPNTGVDPLNVMSHIYLALQTINSREIDPMDNLVLTIGKMQGGDVNNVIPNEAEMRGTIRTLSNETRAMVKSRMEAIVSSVGTAFGAQATVEWCNGCPVLMQDPAVYKEVAGYLKGVKELPVIDIDDNRCDLRMTLCQFPHKSVSGGKDRIRQDQRNHNLFCGAGDTDLNIAEKADIHIFVVNMDPE
jgi:hippurate hydrolase